MAQTVEVLITAKDNASHVFRDMEKSAGGLEKTMSRLGGVLQTAGGFLLAQGITAAVQGFKSAVDGASEFESSLNFLQAVSNATGDEMARISDLAIALGADMTLPATSAGNAAKAMTELAKAGLSVEDTMGAAKGTLQLAAAGMLEEARAAEITANALNSFGLEGTEAVRIADLLAAGANSSSAEVTDMADALQMSSAVFAAANIPIQDLVTTIGQMANAGIKGSDAGTSLKQMLLSLEAPSDKAAGLMKELGLAVYDAQGTMLPMRDLIGQFTEKLSGLTQEQRDAALATIFGSDAVRAANIVMLGGVDAYDKMATAVTKQGAAQDLAAAKTKGLAGAFEGLKSQVETVLLIMAKPLMPVFENAIRGIADVLSSPEIQTGMVAFGNNMASLFTLLGTLGSTAADSGFGQWLGELGGAINLAAGQIYEALLPALQALQPIFDELGRVIGPILVAGLKALGNELVQRTIPNFAAYVVMILKSIPPTIEFAKVVGGQINQAIAGLSAAWGNLNTTIQAGLQWISETHTAFTDLVTALQGDIAAGFQWFIDNVINPFTQALAALKNYIGEVIAALANLAAKIGGGLPSIPSAADVGGAANDFIGGIFGGGGGSSGGGGYNGGGQVAPNRTSNQNNNITVIMPNVRTGRDAHDIVNQMNRNIQMRVGQGLG